MRNLILAGLVFAAGCTAIHTNLDTSLRKRASFDLDCAPEKLQTVELDNFHWGATGCGKRASYSTTTPNCLDADKCVWKAELASEPAK